MLLSIGSKSYFVTSEALLAERTTSELLSGLVKKWVEALGGPDGVAGIVSDNTSVCRSAKCIVQNEYPLIIPVQDTPHVADLMIEDMAKLTFSSHSLISANQS